MYTLPLHAATSVVANNALPNFDKVMSGALEQNPVISNNGLTMDITQTTHNAVIKWNSFDVGGSATVNFWGPDNHNTLNYVNSANMSQIYGTINANNNGNIFIVNPAGVQIGNSAQINVGSLYVSNSKLTDDALKAVDENNINFDFNAYMKDNGAHTDAALMSLGNINATNVTFEGDGRIVIDSERIKNAAGSAVNNDFKVHTNHAGNVLIGYDAYVDKDNNNDNLIDGYVGQDKTFSNNVYVNGNLDTNVKGYMWVEDVEQLQAINTNLSGNYALRNSIDATGTEQKHFTSIGSDNNAFSGKFDGIDYNIFGLNIKETGNNVGLFGYTDGATINNVTLVGGSITGGSITGGSITGGNNVGAVVGNANNTILNNVVNSAAVSGNSNVGGIVGSATNSAIKDAINTGTINGSVDNVGGLIGNLQNSKFIEATDTTKEVEKGLIGNSYNLGDVSGNGHNVGGLVGSASSSTIGDGTNLVYNRMDVTGAYNVGGIVGNITASTVQNAENSGTVLASGHNNGKYIFHTDNAVFDGNNDKLGEKDVYIANAGGIVGTSSADSTITDVLNTGDVSSSKVKEQEYYAAGNVGGIVGSAVDTNITNATNRENEVRGAHNVGGVAGYFGSTKGDSTDKDTPHYTVTNGINDGGDIMATGARNENGFVKEKVRSTDTGAEETIIGNMGGVVGYLDGDNVYVTGSANRGTVHSLDITGDTVSKASQASNTGGVVGKIDRSVTKTLSEIKNNIKNAAVSNSYNTGDVRGYMGVGGVVGMMYNGEVAGSYNLGSINTTRRAADAASNAYPSVNMGGVVGDTTEQTTAKALIYDVYNKGQIGDETYNYYARHVGGVVGRLSGDVEKAYNTGAIYNGYNVVGGIAGWFYTGSINNSFNTGNITVINHDTTAGSQVGGIVGGVGLYSDTKGSTDSKISNAYNLGTIRSFAVKNGDGSYTTNQIGGIIGFIMGNSGHDLKVENVYTTGNLYAGRLNEGKNDNGLGSIIGVNSAGGGRVTVTNAYYIRPQDGLFTDLTRTGNATGAMDFDKKSNSGNYGGFTFTTQSGGDVDGGSNVAASDNNWRIYDGNTPILNAFLPNTEDYFYDKNLSTEGITSIQYGTAYDPLLTIIKANGNKADLTYNWSDLGISNAAGLVVYGAGLTLNKVNTSGGSGYFGGTIYADGALNLNGGVNDIGLGSAADIYGSAVNITTDGKVTIYGDVTATGNGTTAENNPDTDGSGSITITASDVDVYGTLTSASNTQGATVTIPGIEDSAVTWTPGDINNPYASMADIADRFAHTTGASAVDGNITINAKTKLVVDDNDEPILDENGNKQYIGGNVNLYFGNKEQGLITTGGNLTVIGTGDVYVDSDLDIGGDMTLTSTGADSEVVLTLTNIGKVQANRFAEIVEKALNGKDLKANRDDLIQAIVADVEAAYPGLKFDSVEAGYIVDALKNYAGDENNRVQAFEKLNNEIAVEYMHDFMHSFAEGTQNKIALNAVSGDAKLTVDMWVEDVNGSKFDFTKYDSNFTGTGYGHKFINELNNLNFTVNNTDGNAADTVYVEVSTGEQLKAIQNAGSEALGYNYALMGDINASDVEDYVAIGTGNEIGFTGTFDGRGNRIIGLNVSGDDAGIFSTVGTNTVNNNDGTTTTYTGTVKDVNIYSGTFTGTTTAGAVAGENNGRIEGIVTFGNTVTSNGNAGGIVGVNNSGSFSKNETTGSTNDGVLTNGIYDVESTGSVIAGSSSAVAGGLVGKNDGGLANSFSDSAVTVATGVKLDKDTTALGGVVGINNGNVQYVDSLGVTNGGATNSSNIGGIIGTNNGNMYSGYNESIVSGADNVGGVIGENEGKYENDKWNGGTVANVVNATGVTGTGNNVGGLVGVNSGSVTNGRNNGTIAGTNYVGGLVGDNADEHSILTNLVNDSSAEILGVEYVGGIAGKNRGTITADRENNNLINRGSITGHKYVGGVAGLNVGTITNTNIDVELKVNNAVSGDHQYFGGIVGQNGDDKNEGTIENATNSNKIVAPNASYVGGIVGWNTQKGKLIGMGNSNEGEVIGGSYVGGVIGKNDAAIGSKNAAQVGIKNEGVVIATNGGAGGLIGENNAAITNTIMTNKGEVHGNNSNDGSGTGGLIGTNSGAISYSSMTNEVTGTVTGVYNVGGLIGVNKADITGGRDTVNDKDSGYYLNKIYNNGVINVGNYTDADKDGKYEFAASNGQNIGGLFGTNSGKVEAAYNTGAINASGSTNVGGIAGVNEQGGKLDQVFNTVMTGVDDKGNNVYGTITGGTNVGGLIGNNTGTLSNAYNTTEVSGNAASAGNLVGTNSGTVQYVYGYGVDSIDELIGEVTGTGSISHGHAIGAAENSWFQQDVYEDFTFGANGWKIYDGSTLPMLSVFLTKVTVVDQHLVNQYFSAKHYGELHQITADDIKALIAIGAISAPDGFGAFNNNNGLIQGVADDAMANSGNWLYSQQILGSNINGLFNPNNLGYDISLVYSPFENEDWPNNHWNYLFNDAPFDRNKDFRERKAEVNFVDGGMEI